MSVNTSMDEGLFAGLKVIDCASFIAAPAAATILSDFGADVIKVEPPGEGDAYRQLYQGPGQPISDINYPWLLESRNKRSIAIDLRSADGLSVLHRLVAGADVFITNLPLPARRRLQVGYDQLGPLNPRLIYASFTAYGERGAEADKPGFDSTAYWARSGLMDTVKAEAGAPPARAVPGMGDHPSSLALYGAIVTALYRRQQTGTGGLVSSSLIANGAWANAFFVQSKLSGARFIPRPPRELLPNACTNMYRCRDGRWFTLSVLNEARYFGVLLEAIERTDLADDPRFCELTARRAHSHDLIAIFDVEFAKQDWPEWRRRLDDVGITFGVIATLDDIPGDQQMREAEAVVPFADGSGMTVNSPFLVEGLTKKPPRTAPALGGQTDDILREFGYDAAAIAALRAARAVA